MSRLGKGTWRVGGFAIAALMVMSVVPLGAWAEETTATATGNRVFFRGGFAALTSPRGGEAFTDTYGAGPALGVGPGAQNATNGYYVGGGTELMLTRDVWGMMKNIAVLGEIGVEYKRWNSRTSTSVVPTAVNAVAGGTVDNPAAKIQVTMLTVNVAPKVKFMQGTDFQPWIIPVGLDFHVISPPSNQTQYLDIGVQFGAGAEYRIWKELWLGMDARYHLASNQTNTVNNYGTVGAYVGIGF